MGYEEDKLWIIPQELKEISSNLKTQDNRITKIPIFIVQQKNRIYGMDQEYAEDYVWYNTDEGFEADDETSKKLEKYYEPDDDGLGMAPPENGWIKSYYKDTWEFVTACFTEQGCKDYLRLNGHNLKEPRIYVESGHRNKEWENVRKYLMGLT